MAIIKNPLTLVKQEGGQTQGEYFARVVDYDGTVLKMEWLNDGDTFEMPTPPTHSGLVFDGWSSSQAILDNKITIDNNNFIAGPLYYTSSGKTEIDIELNIVTGLIFEFYCYNGATIEWGDGTNDVASSNGYISHTYSNYGEYTIYYSNGRLGDSSNSNINYSSDFNQSKIIKNVRVSNNLVLDSQTQRYWSGNFNNCRNLETITTPNKAIWMGFSGAYSLKTLIVPLNSYISFNNLISIENFVFAYAMAGSGTLVETSSRPETTQLKYIVLPKAWNMSSNTLSNLRPFIHARALINFIIPETFNFCGQYAFNQTNVSNKILKFASETTVFNSNCFQNCFGLRKLDLSNLTNLSNPLFLQFYQCGTLEEVILPSNLTVLQGGAFSGCSNLRKVTFPSTLTTLNSGQTFYGVSNCVFDFTACQQIPSLASSNVFQTSVGNAYNACSRILVPASLYNDWIAATNWANYANYIIAV